MEAKKVAADHWAYIKGLLDVHNIDPWEVERIGFHYQTAFVHGWKHGIEETNKRINGMTEPENHWSVL